MPKFRKSGKDYFDFFFQNRLFMGTKKNKRNN